jgi:hypothetical protein
MAASSCWRGRSWRRPDLELEVIQPAGSAAFGGREFTCMDLQGYNGGIDFAGEARQEERRRDPMEGGERARCGGFQAE